MKGNKSDEATKVTKETKRRSDGATKGSEPRRPRRGSALRYDVIMRRRMMIIVLLLVIGGAIVNVAVAWELSCRNIPVHLLAMNTAMRGCRFDQDVHIVNVDWLAKAAKSQERFNRPASFYAIASPVRQIGCLYSTYESPSSLHLSVFEGRFGLPFPSLAGGTRTKLPSGSDQRFAIEPAYVCSVPMLDPSTADPRFRCSLPLLPLWPGFAINTIFYSAVMWMVFFVPGMVRRTLRRRRGQCPACAYPVGTSRVCTECGNQIPFPLRGRAREEVGRTETSNAHDDAERSTHPLAPSLKGGGKDPA